MRHIILLFVLAVFWGSAHAATYQYTGPVYTGITDFTAPCDPTATCQNYPAGGRVTGQFTTAAPLGLLSDTSILAQLTSYSFTDGIHTFSSSDSRSRVLLFRVTTNVSGQITSAHISLQQWAEARSPHLVNDWFGNLFISSAGTVIARHNSRCDSVDAFDDVCGAVSDPASSSSASAVTPGAWQTVHEPTSVPTLSTWALLALAGLIGLAGLWGRQRHV